MAKRTTNEQERAEMRKNVADAGIKVDVSVELEGVPLEVKNAKDVAETKNHKRK